MTYHLAVFGKPVEHSLSPLIHQHFASQFTSLDPVTYDRILVNQPFGIQVHNFFEDQPTALGCNVTVPCKFLAYELSTTLSPRAQRAGSVNTLKVERTKDGIVVGYYGDNTDGVGFISDLQRLHCPLDQAHVLLVGCGGAAYGIAPCLLESGIAQLTLVNRSLDKAETLAKKLKAMKLGPSVAAYSYEDLPEDQYDVIINATSLSLSQELPPLADTLLAHATFVYDLFYTKDGTTVFTEKARALGVSEAYDGLGMLVGQAAHAWHLWFGEMPDVESTLLYMRSVLEERAE